MAASFIVGAKGNCCLKRAFTLFQLASAGNDFKHFITYDKTWGTGIPLDSPCALIEDKWYNKGWMSDILTSIRDCDM